MGIIIKQSIKGTIWSYWGVIIGFVTTGILFPDFLTTDTIGLFSVLLSYSILSSQFASLGFNGVTNRLFPYFRDEKNQHNGFIFLAFAVITIGFTLFLIGFYLYYPNLIENNAQKSALLAEYAYLIIPLTFFLLFYTVLDVYNKLLYDAVLGTFLQEFFQRFMILLITILFIFKVINLHQFILLYAIAISLKTVVMFVYLLYKKQLSFRPQLSYINKKLKKEIISVALFSILTGLGSSIVFNIDKIIINKYMGLSSTGVYTIAFFFGTLVVIPSRTLLRISGTLIADAWKRNDVDYINDLYKKSCINQFIIGAFLFGGIWINIDNILQILGPEYIEGKWVILFIGLGYLFDMATGANGQIIALSKYYKASLYFTLMLIVLVIISMFIFIPLWGITGAAISIAFAFLLNNSLRYIFLYRKYKMQPFNWRFIFIPLMLIILLGINYFIPQFPLIADILLRSSIYSLYFLIIILSVPLSTEIKGIIMTVLKRFHLKK